MNHPIINFTGIVIHGKEVGRTLGFPTANIELASGIIEDGVYALSITIDDLRFQGVGTYRESISLFEAHVFEYSGDLYEKILDISILGKIRNNQKFNSLEELKNQIQKDSASAKTFAF